MKMKRFALVLLALVLLCTAVCAETSALKLYDAAVELLTDTGNVTLTGNAAFSLDGKQFKTVETTYVQDGLDSKWVLDLASPRADGSLKKNGFTVVANNRYKYAVEVYDPSVCKIAECDPQPAILRSSVALTQLTSLGRAIVEQMPEWSANEISNLGDGKMSIHIQKEQIPGSVSELLSLGVLMAVQRTLYIEDDSVATPPYPDEVPTFEDYAAGTTPTRAIINYTEKYELTALNAEISLDENGRYTEVSGEAHFVLHTFQDGDHEMDITFSGKAFDYGNSTVSAFDPAEYGTAFSDGMFFCPPVNELEFGPGLG